MSTRSHFSEFTRKFALSKTLRFELKPYGEIPEDEKQIYDNCSTFTEFHLKKVNLEYYNDEKSKNANLEIVNFLRDQEIEDAYQILKPVVDIIHEEFITQSLESGEAKKIDFSNYLELKKKLSSLKKKKNSLSKESQLKEIKEVEKEIEKLENDKGEISKAENDLRKFFEELYKKSGDDLKSRINGVDLSQVEEGESDSTQEENKEEGKSKGFRKLLTAKILLEYIKNNTKIENGEEKEKFTIYTNTEEKEKIERSLEKFNRFATYFKGFDTNRLNYYETKKEASTAVATRIVNENLPKFVDNIFLFEKQKDEYIKIYGDLKNANKDLKIKDKKGSEIIVTKFNDEIFTINYFTNCLSQKQIDDYNEKIGDNNFIINLYNQLHSKTEGFKKLPQFKILFKQIGCGEKNDFVKLIKSDEELIEKLKEIRLAGEKYFIGEKKEGEKKHTIYDFINILQNRENSMNEYIGTNKLLILFLQNILQIGMIYKIN